MSPFGFGFRDITESLKDLNTIIAAIKNGLKVYESLLNISISLESLLRQLETNVKGSRADGLDEKAARRKDELEKLIGNCGNDVKRVLRFLEKNRVLRQPMQSNRLKVIWYKFKVGSADLASLVDCLHLHISLITGFLSSLIHDDVQHMAKRSAGFSMYNNNTSHYHLHQHQHQHQHHNNNNIQFQTQSPTLPSINSGHARRVICDGCDRSICGVRHKCQDCPDFDYCADCFRGRRQDHPFGHSFRAVHSPEGPRWLPANDPYYGLPANNSYPLLASGYGDNNFTSPIYRPPGGYGTPYY